MNIIQNLIEKFSNKAHGEQGCTLLNGATTITGKFYGFSVGETKPDSIVLTIDGDKPVRLGTTTLAANDDIIDYITSGGYFPIGFTSITTTGTGSLILWNK